MATKTAVATDNADSGNSSPHNGRDANKNGSAGDSSASSAADTNGSNGGDLPDPTLQGKCKWFNVLKGFGFITPDDPDHEEVFVHQSVLRMPGFRSLDAGESVLFAAKRTQRGWEATNVIGPGKTELKGSSVHPLGKRRQHKIRCFNCGRYGNHTAAKCPEGPMDKCCYICHQPDHVLAQCPQNTQPHKSPMTRTNGHALPAK